MLRAARSLPALGQPLALVRVGADKDAGAQPPPRQSQRQRPSAVSRRHPKPAQETMALLQQPILVAECPSSAMAQLHPPPVLYIHIHSRPPLAYYIACRFAISSHPQRPGLPVCLSAAATVFPFSLLLLLRCPLLLLSLLLLRSLFLFRPPWGDSLVRQSLHHSAPLLKNPVAPLDCRLSR